MRGVCFEAAVPRKRPLWCGLFGTLARSMRRLARQSGRAGCRDVLVSRDTFIGGMPRWCRRDCAAAGRQEYDISMANSYLDIAVGVLRAADGRVLIARRRPGTPGAGKWEFPGGKRESGESMAAALDRELAEELGIEVRASRPLLSLCHDYTDRTVWLDIRLVTDWRGQPAGCEGQLLAWCAPENLFEYDLLEANRPVVHALQLPMCYAITPEFDGDTKAFLAAAGRVWQNNTRLLRLRAPRLSDAEYEQLAHALQRRANVLGGTLLLDRDVALTRRVGAAGMHWPASRLRDSRRRPVAADQWFAVSCHDRAQLQAALTAGADFATLSPVRTTATHPDARPMGWPAFSQACWGLPLPVYALGGLGAADVATACGHGAQGVAGIRSFWPDACSA